MAITNAEKFKTAKERKIAFNKYCSNYSCDCKGCEIFKMKKEKDHTLAHCIFVWLEMEAAKEKPLPCPFCGSEIEVQKIVNEDLYKIECSTPECMCSISNRYFFNKTDAIIAWNKRA